MTANAGSRKTLQVTEPGGPASFASEVLPSSDGNRTAAGGLCHGLLRWLRCFQGRANTATQTETDWKTA